MLRDTCDEDNMDTLDYSATSTVPRKNVKVTPLFYFCIVAAVMGGSFQFGYNSGVINEPQEIVKAWVNHSVYVRTGEAVSDRTLTTIWSFVVSCYLIGGMIGGLSAGWIAQRLGRRRAMLINNMNTFIASGLFFVADYAKIYELLFVARIVLGINAGLSTGIVPAYLTEIAPIHLRGACGVVNQLAIVSGVLVANILALPQLLGSPNRWQFLFAFVSLPALLHFGLICCPESPRWLYSRGDKESAEKALRRLRVSADIEDEMLELSESAVAAASPRYKRRQLVWPLVICLVMQLSQQFSGINAVIYYSTQIFTTAGLTIAEAKYASLGVSAINALVTIFAVARMDRYGRRVLFLYGLGGMCISATLLTTALLFGDVWKPFSYFAILFVTSFVTFFAIGPSSIPWFIVNEIFTTATRPLALGLCVFVNWLANLTVGLMYPIVEAEIHEYSFLPFAAMLACFWLFAYLYLPETKGRTVDEIAARFHSTPSIQDDAQPLINSYCDDGYDAVVRS